MIGASRESLAKIQESLSSRQGDLSTLSADLFAVASLIANEKSLRQTLADSGQPVAGRQALIKDILGGKVSVATIETLGDVVAGRWSSDGDLVDAVETLGAQAAFIAADKSGNLDRVEDEIFKFGRAVDGSAELQMALTAPALSSATKATVVKDLLAAKVDASTLSVVTYFVSNLRGRRVDAVIDQLVALAAAQRNSVVAEVRSAIALDESQTKRLAAALAKITGKQVRVNVAIDKNVVGGISVKIGEEIIDGTVATRLEHARRALLA